MPEISMIMPCYNTESSLLIKCVESIIAQSFSDFELIIVDDGSNEDYRSVYDKIKAMDNRIQVKLKENGGVSVARNYGLQFVTGNYVVYVDSDDILVSCFLEEAYEIIQKENADIVFGCNIHMNDYDAKKETEPVTQEEIVTLSGSDVLTLKPRMIGERLRFENGLIYIGRGPWTRLVKREIAVNTPFTEGLPICEDIIWNLQILEKSKKVCYVKKAWYVYNMGNDQATTKRYNEKVAELSKMGLEATAKYLNFNNDGEFFAYCQRCVEDLYDINKRFLENEKCTLSKKEKNSIRRRLYTEAPWNTLADKRFFRLGSKMDKIKFLLYKCRLLLTYDAWRRR